MIQFWIVGSLLWWRSNPVERTMFMRIQAWKSVKIEHKWQNYRDISPLFKRAVLVGEDARFFEHSGFDWDGLQLALEKNEKNSGVVAGGSTISQQLAKNLFLYPQRSFIRKGQETLATIYMEKLWSKQRILEVYLNSVELGRGIYGIEAASQHYFHKSNHRLSQKEAIYLASLLPNPRYYQKHPTDVRFKFHKRFITRYFNTVKI